MWLRVVDDLFIVGKFWVNMVWWLVINICIIKVKVKFVYLGFIVFIYFLCVDIYKIEFIYLKWSIVFRVLIEGFWLKGSFFFFLCFGLVIL